MKVRGAPYTVLSEQKLLAPRAGPIPVPELLLTFSDRREPTWWIVEVDSHEESPAKLELTWTSGGAQSGLAQISHARGTRTCIFANSLVLKAANLLSTSNLVSARIHPVPAPVPTSNVADLYSAVGGAAVVQHPIPPYALWVRLDVADPAVKAGSTIELIEPFTGAVAAHVVYGNQPSPGLPVGDAKEVQITIPAASAYRLTYGLSI